MKKNFLFAAVLSVFLAGLSFGGMSLANYEGWGFVDWNDSYFIGGTPSWTAHDEYTYTGDYEYVGNTITFSNLKMLDKGNKKGDTIKNVAYFPVTFFATGDDISQVYFTYTTYYETGNYTFPTNADGYSNENGKHHVALWTWITPELVKEALNNSGGIITDTFVISGVDKQEAYTLNINVENFTEYKSGHYLENDQILFQVKDGIVVIENGKIASEVMNYAAFHADKYPTGHEYQSVITGEDFITFSGLTLKIYYPDADPVDKDIAYVMAAFFQAGGDNDWESSEIKFYAEKACALGVMGIKMEKFQPNKIVSRAEFGTLLSRILWGDKYDVENPTRYNLYYIKHLNELKKNGIMTLIENPINEKGIEKMDMGNVEKNSKAKIKM